MLSSRSRILNKYLAGENLFLKKVAKFVEDYSKNSNNLLYYDKKELDDYIRESELVESYNDGLSQGKKENSIKIAKKLLVRETSISEISEITGLTKDEIENL